MAIQYVFVRGCVMCPLNNESDSVCLHPDAVALDTKTDLDAPDACPLRAGSLVIAIDKEERQTS